MLKPGGTLAFCGEPSRYGDLISQVPKRAAVALAPAWRRLMRATKRDYFAEPDDREEAKLEWLVDVHAFTPRSLASLARDAGFEDVRVTGEELTATWFGWMNRTLEATAEPEGVPWLWRQYAYRGYLTLQALDRAVLERPAARGDLLQPAHLGPEARIGDMRDRLPANPYRYGLLVIAFAQLGRHVQALIAPKSFYDDFPLGRGWVAGLPRLQRAPDLRLRRLHPRRADRARARRHLARPPRRATRDHQLARRAPASISSTTWSPSTGSGQGTRSPTSPGCSCTSCCPGGLLVRSRQ